MNAMVEFVRGRCTNALFCSVASAGEILRLPAGARFVCAYCGKALVPTSETQGRSALATGFIFGAGMAATGAAMFAMGALFGSNPAPQDSASLPQLVMPVPPQSAIVPLSIPPDAEHPASRSLVLRLATKPAATLTPPRHLSIELPPPATALALGTP